MQRGAVRIIGGKWRGRLIKVAESATLRPTPDRVRETLFNWLSPFLLHARCLDLFAGTGVLGFEALSRGAAYVEMLEKSPALVQGLQAQQRALSIPSDHLQIHQADASEAKKKSNQPFDIIFLDPPYAENLLLPCCFYLEEHAFLAKRAYIYLEARELIKDNDLPNNWHILKSKQTGQVFYHLAQRELKNDEFNEIE